MYVWIVSSIWSFALQAFFSGSRALFTRLTSTFFYKNNFKIGFQGTIHIFKNYFVIVFSVSVISGIQTGPEITFCFWTLKYGS